MLKGLRGIDTCSRKTILLELYLMSFRKRMDTVSREATLSKLFLFPSEIEYTLKEKHLGQMLSF